MPNVIEIRVRATDETGPVYDKTRVDAAAAGRDSGAAYSAAFASHMRGAGGEDIGSSIGAGIGTGLHDSLPEDTFGPDSPEGTKFRENSKKTGEEAGKDAGDGMSPMLVTALAGGLSVGAPLILGAFGTVTAGMAAMALKNNAVIKQDFTDLGTVAGQAITQAAAPAAGTLHQALVTLESDVQGLTPQLKGMFVNAEPDITSVTNGVAAFAANALPGMSAALQASQVDVADLASGLGSLGSGVGSGLEGLTRDAYTTGAGMKSLLDTTGHLASTLGGVLGSAASAGSTALMGLDDALNPTLSLVQKIANPATVGAVGALFAGMKLDPSISSGLINVAAGLDGYAKKAVTAEGESTRLGSAAAGVSGALEKGASVMSGPWGLAIDAGVGLVTGLVGSLINASHASDALTLSQQGLADAVAKDSGVAGQATAAFVAAQAQADGMAQATAGAGVSLDVWTQAVLGNGDAQQQVTAAVEKLNQAQRNQAVTTAESTADTGKFSDAQRMTAVNAAKAAAANNTLTDANQKVINTLKAEATQTAATIAQQEAYEDALNNITNSYTGFTSAVSAGHAALVANAQQSALNTVSALNLGSASYSLGSQLYGTVSAFNVASAGAQAYSTVLQALNGTTMSLDQAQNTLASQMNAAKTSFAANKYSLDLSTQAGVANRQALVSAAQAISALGAAEEQKTGSIADANKVMKEQETAFINATGATGKAKDAIKEYIDELLNIPQQETTVINRVYTTSDGVVRHSGSSGRGAMATGGVASTAATGGARNGLVQINEQGQELVRLQNGTTVIPHANVESMAATGQLAGGQSRGTEALELRIGPGSDGVMAQAIMHLIRIGKLQILKKAIV